MGHLSLQYETYIYSMGHLPMQYVTYIYTVWDINCTLFIGDWLLGCYLLVIGD